MLYVVSSDKIRTALFSKHEVAGQYVRALSLAYPDERITTTTVTVDDPDVMEHLARLERGERVYEVKIAEDGTIRHLSTHHFATQRNMEPSHRMRMNSDREKILHIFCWTTSAEEAIRYAQSMLTLALEQEWTCT